jgi:hypothetical protein
MADPFKDGSGNFTYGFIADVANVLEDDGLITSSATETLDYGLVSDAILYSVQLTGISLTAQAGTIAQTVSDSIQITGINADITAESIAASGIQNRIIELESIELSSNLGELSAQVADSVSITGLEALSDVATISASGIQSPSIALIGIDLLAELGEITEQVVDSELISGIDLTIVAQNISAFGIANQIIVLNGIGLQSTPATIIATGAEIAPEEYSGGRFAPDKKEVNATAKLQTLRASAYAGRPTPRGFTVINGGARVFTLETTAQIGQTAASGQLGIDEESLLMLLVA